MKDLLTKKRSVRFENDDRMQYCGTIGLLHFSKALCDLGAIISLMSLIIYKKLGLGDSKHTTMPLMMAYRTVKRTISILHDLLVKVEPFIFPVGFVILECEVYFKVLLNKKRPFHANGRALVDMEKGQMIFRLNNEEANLIY